jgi:hypothetical protein
MTTAVKVLYIKIGLQAWHNADKCLQCRASGNLKVITLSKDQYHQNVTYIAAH